MFAYQTRRFGNFGLTRHKAGLVAVITLGLYAFSSLAGNPATAASSTCAMSTAAVENAKGKNTGDLANFLLAHKSQNLTEISFAQDGEPTSIAKWQGRTVLLNLWATWCAPCLREMPALDALQKELGGDGFEVVAVSIDMKSDKKPKAFYKKTGIKDLAFYQDQSMGIFTSLRKLGIAKGMPTTVLIGKDGCMIGSLSGPAEWHGQDAITMIKSVMK